MLDFIHSLHWHFSMAREYPGIHSKLRDLRDEEKMTPQEWQHLRDEHLLRLLIFAKNQVPHYRETFEQVGFEPKSAELPQDLERVPILTKDHVRNHLRKLIAENASKSRIFENATGGSTGIPLTFYQDLAYQTTAEALDAYIRELWGIKPYDRTALVWGADRDFHELSLKEQFYIWRHRSRSLNAFRMTDDSLLAFCQMLTRWRPPYLMGYSSALEALAYCARKNGIGNLSFKSIRSTAETLWPHQRKIIEETFNSPVYNFYGSREINNLASECPEERRLHMISTWRYIEIVDEKGNQVPNGQPGNIVVTDMSNYAMPFIRYCNEDIAQMAREPCPCGRPSPVLEALLGRSTDLIYTPRGDIIHGEFFTHLFYGRNDIYRFQVYQSALERLVLRYVPIGEPPKEYIEKVVEKIRERMGEGIEIEVEVCDKIPIPPSGKYRFTISDVNKTYVSSSTK